MPEPWRNLALFTIVLICVTGLLFLDAAPFTPRITPDLGGFDAIYTWAPHLVAVIVAGLGLGRRPRLAPRALAYALIAAISGASSLMIFAADPAEPAGRPGVMTAAFSALAMAVVAGAQILIGWLVLFLIMGVRSMVTKTERQVRRTGAADFNPLSPCRGCRGGPGAGRNVRDAISAPARIPPRSRSPASWADGRIGLRRLLRRGRKTCLAGQDPGHRRQARPGGRRRAASWWSL